MATPDGTNFRNESFLAFAEVDVVALEGDLAEIGLDAELGQPGEALVEIGIDLVVGPRRAGQVVEEELDAGAVRRR